MVVLTVERLLLAVRTKPGMLLNILQYTGQSPATNNSLVEDVKSAEVETPKQVKTSKSPNLKEGYGLLLSLFFWATGKPYINQLFCPMSSHFSSKKDAVFDHQIHLFSLEGKFPTI